MFSYNLEDTDHLSGGANVFNGQDSVVWCNIRDAFGDKIAKMYQQLRSEGKLSYALVERMFEEHQDKWSEAIFNEDSYFKYLAPLVAPEPGENPTGAYLSMLQGSKEEQRKWWLYNRFRYMDSKYVAGDALTDIIQMRGYAKANITVTPYADVYASVKYGSYIVQHRGQRDVAQTLICPLDALNDTEIYVYSASQLSSIGDLSGLKVGFADFSNGTKLSSIKIGDAGSGYSNNNLKELYLGANTLLKVLDVRNCPALGTDEQKTVDISGCANIEDVYFEGTAIQGLALPVGGILKKLHLPGTITNLTVRNQASLTEFVLPSYAGITTLRVENSSSVIDTKAILNAVAAGSRIRLIGIAWECVNAAEISALLDKLDTMRGLDEGGNNVDTAQISGTIHTDELSGSQISAFTARYPHISFIADTITAIITYKTWDGASVITTESFLNGGNGTKTNSTQRADSSDGHYAYTPNGWSREIDGATDPTALNNVTADRTVYAAYTATEKSYTVTWKNADGTVLETDTNVLWGTAPHYDGSTPSYHGQTSTGWDTDTTAGVTGDTVITATYLPMWTATFVRASDDGGGTLYTQEWIVDGQTPVYGGATPTTTQGDASKYPFEGWNPTLGPIHANTTYTAKFGSPVEVAEITDTWDQIIQHIDVGDYATRYKIGNYKPLDLGTEGIVNMQIVAMNADALAAGGGNAATSWVSKELLTTSHRMNPEQSGSDEGTGTIGGWPLCEMRTYLKDTVKPLIPSNVRSAIKEVTKYSLIYNTAGSAVNDVTSTEDVWLPSRREIFGAISNAETQGPIYEAAFPNNASRVKSQVGASSASWWWLRSPGIYYFNCVTTDGSSYYDRVYKSGAVVLGFCI